MELKPGYKQTEVGVIPEDWSLKQVQQIVDGSKISSGIYKDKNFYGRGSQIIKLGDVFSSDYFDPNSAQRAELSNDEVSVYRVRVGDIIIALASVKLEGVGKVMLVTKLTEETVYDHNVALIRLIGKFDQRYVFYLFKSNIVRKLIGSKATQVGTTFLKTSTIREFVLPFPILKAEQTAIANALSDADALIQSLTHFITKKRQIKQGAMQTLLNPYENGRLKEGWVVKKLGEIFEITAGGDLRKNEFSKTADENHQYPIYSNALTNCGLYGYCKSFDYSGSFITVTARGNVGFAVARNCTFVAIGRLLVLKPINDVNCQFVSEYINLRVEFANENTGVPQLTAPQILNYEIAIPSKNSEQIRIATILSGMDAEIAALEAKLAKYRHIKQGMMQNLLTGKIRLI